MINLHERMLPTSAEPATSWSPVGRRIQLSHRGMEGGRQVGRQAGVRADRQRDYTIFIEILSEHLGYFKFNGTEGNYITTVLSLCWKESTVIGKDLLCVEKSFRLE